ncbi:DMSO/TMAO reductase YedYZ, molybdopterin-dependent catalytic subunit [Nocardioides alpinus]|uniref:DMSO/TMAO reductase YedYZ, molybdopterin-dependent catalytic subunit n=1 Tax=Nocardioides alpinus TaxID=748909 RepID=A0A1I0XVY5_9ACTN|nr:sulfite oxidase [Nocardioides alpinus]PKH42859.1 sulfite oxidase [Nocardioides alpinus]SFB04470.1 DMSO/TMAO reductase YedYZ, molybdopterin-dependent catalytic subunit [Nocardioides alpinus]
MTSIAPTRRGFLTAAAVAGATALAPASGWRAAPARAAAPFILKPTPPAYFTDFGTNAEMLWSSVDPKAYLTPQSRLFVRNHTRTPQITRAGYALRVYGDGLATSRAEGEALSLTLDDLQRLPHHEHTAVLECTGNGRRLFKDQQGQTVSGTAWTLGAVGTVRWTGVRLRDVLASIGLAPDAVSIEAAGLDDPFVSGGTDYGRVRRPFPVSKALDDAVLAWGMNGEDLLPDHGYPLRLVLPGWVGIASIKWLGSLEVSRSALTSPWNTTFYRMTGPEWPVDSPPLTVNPVRSAWELARDAVLPSRPVTLTGRSWSGAGRISRVSVSLDGGTSWRPAVLDRRSRQDEGWTRWSVRWGNPRPGHHEILARATDERGRTQPLEAVFNTQGYFFDAVVRHPVRVV